MITLKELLCSAESYELVHPRGELEIAGIELLSAILQTVFCPETDMELRRRFRKPMSEEEYDERAQPFEHMFNLMGENAFMQRLAFPLKEKKTKNAEENNAEENNATEADIKITKMQKLYPGLPEGQGGGQGSGCLYVGAGEISHVCPACTALGLYNQASGAPAFGGGFKVSLRGESPLTVMVYNRDLRKMLWSNVLSSESRFMNVFDVDGINNAPSWISGYEASSKSLKKNDPVVATTLLGMTRGLFWQPLSIQVLWSEKEHACDVCGLKSNIVAVGFYKQPMYFQYSPTYWAAHPYSPFKLGEETDKYTKEKREIMMPVNAKESWPIWQRLNDIFPCNEKGKEWSPVVRNYCEIFGEFGVIPLVLGGYKNSNSKIERRWHEVVSIIGGWEEKIPEIRKIVDFGIGVREQLGKGIAAFAISLDMKTRASVLKNKASEMFSQMTEQKIMEMITQSSQENGYDIVAKEIGFFRSVVESVVDTIESPYACVSGKLDDKHPGGMKAYVMSKKKILSGFAGIARGYSQEKAVSTESSTESDASKGEMPVGK